MPGIAPGAGNKRKKKSNEYVTVRLTRKQAHTLWRFLNGAVDRWQFADSTMRTLIQIGKRLSKGIGCNWNNNG